MVSQASRLSHTRQAKRQHVMLRLVIAVVATVGLTAGCQSSSAKKVGGSVPKAAGTASTSASTSASTGGTFKIGDQVQAGTWIVTVHGVTNPYTPSDQFMTPSAGNKFVVVDVEVKNTDSKTQTLSSLLSFTLKDSENRTYDESIAVDTGGPKTPEGDFAAGDSQRGNVAFEVPQNAARLSFVFKSGFIESTTATIRLS